MVKILVIDYRESGRKRFDPLQAACDRTVESLLEFGSYRKPEDDITLPGIEYLPSS